MTILSSQALSIDWIKVRWMEPYISGGLNRALFRTIPRGFYSGWVVKPGTGSFDIIVASDDPSGWGLTSGYSYGAFDTASGWSVAMHNTLDGWANTVSVQAGVSGYGNFYFDLTSYAGQTVYAAMDVNYRLGYTTEGFVKIVNGPELDANPELMVLAKVNVPSVGPITTANIIADDPAYPRVRPFADRYKFGYMSKEQAYNLELLLSNGSVSAAPVFEEEILIASDGPQDVLLSVPYTYTYGGDDLWVFKNGVKSRKGPSRDYIEVDRGDGRGEKVAWTGLNIRSGDRITFRVQKYSAVLTSTTRVLDEGALIDSNVIDFNFSGTGVSVVPDGFRRVKVIIPGGGGGAGAVRTKLNLSGSTIQAYRAVHLLPNNTITACDPTVSGHKLYGVTLQTLISGVSGDVATDGFALGAGPSVVGGYIGADVFVDHAGAGQLTVTPPNPLNGGVIRVGIIDGADGVSGGSPTDILFDRGRLN